MKKNIVVIVLILFTNIINAQFRYPEKDNAVFVKSKKIAIELLDEDNPINTTLNKALKDIFITNWNNSTEIDFLSSAKMKEKIDAKDNSYTYLFQEKTVTKFIEVATSNTSSFPRLNIDNRNIPDTKNVVRQFNHYSFSLKRFKANKLSLITRICFANKNLSKPDYLFLAQQLDLLINYSNSNKSSNDYYGNVKDNITKIKNSEFLILKDFFKDKEIPKIDSYYKNKFKMVDLNEHEETILNKTKNKIYIKILYSDLQNIYMWVIIDSETGRVLSQMGFGGIHSGFDFYANKFIKPKHLKYITHKTFQKINSRHYR